MIQAAIFGLGRWGQNLVNSVQDGSNVIRFKSAVVQAPEKYQSYAKDNGLHVTSNAAEVLSDPAIQMVVLATPHHLHNSQIQAAANAGKHVFCEKPLALTLQEAQEAVMACEKAKVLLGVGHDKRFWPSMQELKKIVASGVLGDLIHIEGIFTNENINNFQVAWRNDAKNVPGGSLTATGIHVLDAFTNLMGDVKSVDGIYYQRNKGTQDTMGILFEFSSGATGLLSSPRPAPVFWRVHVFGSLGNVEVRGPHQLTISMVGKTEQEVQQFEPINALKFQLEAFANSIASHKNYMISPAEILRTVKVFEAAAKSIDTRSRVVL